MKNNLIKIYNDFVSNNFISYDEDQIKILNIFEKIWTQNQKINFFLNKEKFKGIYLYGKVGIGKTFLINLFINNIEKSKKFHFNHFMINLHAFVNNHNKKDFALEIYVKKLSKKYKIIFIDELHVFNIVDALLLKKIFYFFQKYKIFIITSSNYFPNDLYKNGLQREDFIPFIEHIKNNFKVLHLESFEDYRRQMLNQAKTYYSPINNKTINEFNKLFDRFVDKGEIHIRKIKTKSRSIRLEKCTANIAYCEFSELCVANLAHEDYKNIANEFSILFINKVPEFSDSESDQCRRFISLIDMLYEKKCSVVILAAKPINSLCNIQKLKNEFERTASRLYEMTIITSEIE